MEIIDHQGFGECVLKSFSGVYLPHLHNIVVNMLPNKMVANRHCFIDQDSNRISRVQHHTHVVHKYMCRFGYLITHLFKMVLDHNRLIDSLLWRCELGTKC